MSLSIQPPYPVVNDTDGQPLENGYIWIGAANLPPITNPISIYWDAALTQPAAQPVRTQGGYPSNAGNPGRLYAAQNYSILVQNSRGVTLYSAPQQTELYGTDSGGTGLTSYAVGDLLYADGSASLAKLAAVATGNVLRSGGVATAPAWGKVDLTTDVTGVLPAANGGTGLSAPGTSGNVLSSDGTTWQSVAVSTLVPDATDSVKGVVELATDAEVKTGTDTTRAITPDALRKGAIVYTAPQILSSGTEKDFTGIPSWATKVTLLLTEVRTSGASNLRIRVLDTVSPVNVTGYNGSAFGATASSGFSGLQFSAGFDMPDNSSASNLRTAMITLAKLADGGNTWVLSGTFGSSDAIRSGFMTGWITLSAPFDGIRVTTVNGADTFDNVLSKAIVFYE